jgi:RNA polymerase sigma factor (sigma-70 family)
MPVEREGEARDPLGRDPQARDPQAEVALLRRIAAKDRHAFETFYGLYHRRLFSYLFKLTRRPDLVEEVLNEVMFVIWEKAGTFDGRSRPSTWIFGIAYHKALKALAQRQVSQIDEDTPEPVDQRDEPENLAVRRELASALGKAMSALSPDHRAVVELTYYYGRSYQEISEIVGCPVNTVKTRMFHARRHLRELLPDLGVSSHGG